MAKTIEDLFIFLVFASDILFLFFFFLNHKRLKAFKPIVAAAIYCSTDLIVNSLVLKVNIPFLAPIAYACFTALEYSIFAFIIWDNIKNVRFRKFIFWSSLLFLAFLPIYYITTDFGSIDSIPIGISTILILIFSFYFFFEQMNDTQSLFIYSKYIFWFITGIMIYLAGSFFIYVSANHVEKSIRETFWLFTNVFYVVKNIFFGIGVYLALKKKTNSDLSISQLKPYLN
jgi:hypothetical protein